MKVLKLISVSALFITAFSACEKKQTGKLDPNAMIALHYKAPAAAAPSEVALQAAQYLTAGEIVEQTGDMSYYGPSSNFESPIARGFSEPQRDFVNNRLLMWGTDIIDQDGNYVPNFIEAKDIVLRRDLSFSPHITDTIAYIPNAVLRSAETKIKAAYAEKNYTECYKIFDEAFYFIPITGAEWRVLKAAGTN